MSSNLSGNYSSASEVNVLKNIFRPEYQYDPARGYFVPSINTVLPGNVAVGDVSSDYTMTLNGVRVADINEIKNWAQYTAVTNVRMQGNQLLDVARITTVNDRTLVGNGKTGLGTFGTDLILIGPSAGYAAGGNYINAIGLNAATYNTGSYVNAIGESAAQNNSGSYVVAIGTNAAFTNTGLNVNAMGRDAASNNQGGTVNAIGINTAVNNSGSYVNAIGESAAQNNSGSYVVAIGESAALGNTGSYVIAIGSNAGMSNSGTRLHAIGSNAGVNNSGSNVFAFGVYAADGNRGSKVTAIGGCAAQNNSGSFVNAFGCNAARGNEGDNVIAIGTSAAVNNYTSNIIAIGDSAGIANYGAHSIFLGLSAGMGNTSNDQLIIKGINTVPIIQGNMSNNYIGINTTTPAYNLDVSGTSRLGSVTISNEQVGINITTPSYNLDVSGTSRFGTVTVNNGRIDASSVYINGAPVDLSSTTTWSLFPATSTVNVSGYTLSNVEAMRMASSVIAIGDNDTASGNTAINVIAIGLSAGYLNSGTELVAIGTDAGNNNSGIRSVTIGYSAGRGNKGNASTIVGYNAGFDNSIGTLTAFGYSAGSNNTGEDVVCIGRNAGDFNYGDSVIAIGSHAGTENAGSNCIFLGSNAGFNNNISDQLVIQGSNALPIIQGNMSNNYVGINMTTPSYNLDVSGSIRSSSIITGSASVKIVSSYTGATPSDYWSFTLPTASNMAITRTGGAGNVGIGTSSPSYNLDVSGTGRIGPVTFTNDKINIASTSCNVFIGQAGTSGIGTHVTAIGYGAATNMIQGANVVAIGSNSANVNSGIGIVAIGGESARENAGNTVIAIGGDSARENAGNTVIAIGYGAAMCNQLFADNVIALGSTAGYSNSGANCIFLGSNAGSNNISNDQLIVKGTNAIPIIQGNMSNNYVGINMTTPSYNLDVSGSIRSSSIITGSASVKIVSSYTGSTPSDYWSFTLPTASNMAITRTGGAGNVGIGTSSPAYNLDVSGAINAKSLYINGTPVNNGPSTWSTYAATSTINAGGYELSNVGKIIPSNTNILIGDLQTGVNNTGANGIGIGSTALKGNTRDFVIAIGQNAGSNNTGSNGILMGINAGKSNGGNNVIAIGESTGMNNSGANCIFLGSNAGSNNISNDQLIIKGTNSGNPIIQGNMSNNYVGINKTNPAYNLDVSGSINATSYSVNTTTIYGNSVSYQVNISEKYLSGTETHVYSSNVLPTILLSNSKLLFNLALDAYNSDGNNESSIRFGYCFGTGGSPLYQSSNIVWMKQYTFIGKTGTISWSYNGVLSKDADNSFSSSKQILYFVAQASAAYPNSRLAGTSTYAICPVF